MTYANIEDAVSAIGRGELVVVVDDAEGDDEGALILAGETATPEKIQGGVELVATVAGRGLRHRAGQPRARAAGGHPPLRRSQPDPA